MLPLKPSSNLPRRTRPIADGASQVLSVDASPPPHTPVPVAEVPRSGYRYGCPVLGSVPPKAGATYSFGPHCLKYSNSVVTSPCTPATSKRCPYPAQGRTDVKSSVST